MTHEQSQSKPRIAFRCLGCDETTALSESKSDLLRLGLLPFRCATCGDLRPHRRWEGGGWVKTGLEADA